MRSVFHYVFCSREKRKVGSEVGSMQPIISCTTSINVRMNNQIASSTIHVMIFMIDFFVPAHSKYIQISFLLLGTIVLRSFDEH